MADTRAPLLRRMSPSDNASNVAVSNNLVLTFSENVKAGAGFIAIYQSDGTLFRSISVSDSSQVSISGRAVTIKDVAGNNYGGISSPSAFDFTTAGSGGASPPGDTTAPVLNGTSPADNAANVQVDANLTLTFNEAVKAGSGSIVIRKSSDGSLVQTIAVTDASKVTFSGNQVTIDPGANLSPETSYYVVISSGVVRDLANNPFAGVSSPATFNFATASYYVDSTAPVVLFSTPSANITGGANIFITFNEPVKAGTGTIEIRNASDDNVYRTISVTDTSQVSFSERVVTINPSTDLAAGSNYYVVLAPGTITDLDGNEYDGVSSVASFVENAGVIATAIGGPGAIGTTAYGANASAIATAAATSAGAYAIGVSFASSALTANATATGVIQPPLGTSTAYGPGGDPGHWFAGNDVTIDMSALSYDAAMNGTLTYVSSTRIDILGSDGLTYRFFGTGFVTSATSVANIGGTGIWLVELWAGSGADEHIVHAHYADFNTLEWIETAGFAVLGSGDSNIIGSSDDDVLLGFEGDDIIFGRDGNDVIRGGEGDDLLFGGLGSDTLNGDEHEDSFIFVNLEHLDGDSIVGLTAEDKIDLSSIGGLSFIGSNAFTGVAGQVRYTWAGGNTTLQIDSDGNGVSDASLLLTGAQFSLGETQLGSKVLVMTGITPLPGLVLTGTAANNTLAGGTGNDVITGAGGRDTLTGRGGGDTFVYAAVTDSTGTTLDRIMDFDASADRIDLWYSVTDVEVPLSSGSLSPATFSANLVAAVNGTKLGAYHAILFTPNAGTLSGNTYLIVDANGTAGYQANADLVILLGAGSNLTGLTPSDFV